ncbi:uncharacterized protein LOC128127237 [Lactuca sativa]|uniref:uncharacterized protein LOC128127237 n=1 Tax=Lactuca sativa TaxID=4236 RepID=UPI0022AF7E92|nr:uncharacterized protein LOC128127237 [Lactuca sativa]
MLRFQYFDITDPSILWNLLKKRFDHQKDVILQNARDEWRTLRFLDFKKVNEYNLALFRICSQLKYCGQEVTDEDMLEKTYFTFHATNITLMQQYRLQKFTRYSELNACLLVAEQNNELLMKNHESRPSGLVALPKANATLILIKTICVDEGVVEDDAIVILIETKAKIRTLILVVDKVIIVVVARK